MTPRLRKTWRTLGAACLFVGLGGGTLAAQGTITGHVTGADTKQPLSNARVLVIGANVVTATDQSGKYTLHSVQLGTVQVQVFRVGYQAQKKTVTVTAGQTATVDFDLAEAIVTLQEVVTTATGEQRKSELGNAISTLTDVGTKVEQSQTTSLGDLLIAKAPGVIVLPQSTLGGAPNFRIRGVSSISLSNAPIYYVDGVRYSAGDLQSGTDTHFSLINQLNPEEIEDIEIVKGPSAATLYGTNAANGVVVITTKKGRAGTTRWSWSAEVGNVDDRTDYQDMFANWGHSPAAAGVPVRCQLATMNTSKYTNPASLAQQCVSDSLTHYNWLRDPDNTFITMGRRSLYGAQVSGGSDAVRFFLSGDLDNETGPIHMPWYDVQRFESQNIAVRDEWKHPSAQQKASFRGNLSATLSPTLDMGFNVGFGKLDNRIPPESDLIIALYYVGMQNYGFKGPGLDKITTDNNGTPLHDALQWNPGDIMQYVNESDVQRTTASTNAQWRPFSWMVNDGVVGVDLAATNYFHICRLNECPPQSATARVGNVTDNTSRWRNFSAKVTSTSSWNPRPWANLKTSVGGDYTNVETDTTNTNGVGLPPGASTVPAAATRNVLAERQPTAVKTLGLYVQEQVGFRDRLFVTGAVRTDQNSAFGTSFQRVYYPKASVSWLLSDESFFPSYTWLNQLRLRTAYGASGVQPGSTTTFALFTPAAVSIAGRNATSGTDTPGLTESQLANPLLKPEKSSEFEGGFDSQFLDNRLHFEYTYYVKKTKDALINVNLSPSSAAAQLTPLINIGATKNWGHEVTMTAQLWESRRFGWDITVNGSHNSNAVLNLGIDPNTGKPRTLGTGQTRQIPGLPINSQWFHPYSYSDANGDGILQVNEVQVDSSFRYFGYVVPRDLISISNGIDLFGRRIRLQALFDYKGGNSIVDGANNFQCNTAPFACRETQDPTAPLWEQARSIAKYYGSVIGGTTFKSTVGYFRNAQFWKFRELSAVFFLPEAINRYTRSQGGSNIVLAARNLHLWTSFTGIDPEANYGLTQSEQQNEFQTAAPPTYFTIRLNLKY